MAMKRLKTVLLVLATVIGAILLLYPTFANVWNERHTSRVVAAYVEELSDVDNERYAEIWLAAQEFNRRVAQVEGFRLPEELRAEYDTVLDASGLGILGYIEIPKINVYLPIYHGTSDAVLQVAAGHIEWSSLPIGGAGTHCVISGHRGLASARLFTDLPQLQRGDVFYVRVLNELLTYEVDQITTVLPNDLDDLKIAEGEDYFTLTTCTPYGINTHRLLVRGHRVSNAEETRTLLVTSDAVRIEPLVIAPIIAVPIVMFLILLVFVGTSGKNEQSKKGNKDEKTS